MPFSAIERPAPGIGILKSSLAGTPYRGETLHANLIWADWIGLRTHEVFTERNDFSDLAGDWVFGRAAFPGHQPDDEAYLQRLLGERFEAGGVGQSLTGERVSEICREMRGRALVFVDRLAREIASLGPRIVGCTSCYEQHCASIALLRRLREVDPAIVTMMGGPNCETVMGEVTHRFFPWIDYVVSGEADLLFPELCGRILEERELDALPASVLGPRSREAGGPVRLEREVVHEMDRTAIPDYSEYFATLARTKLAPCVEPGIPLETSRGCWWGQKSHCTFCGLNGAGMSYRTKSAERILEEYDSLFQRHGIGKFEAVDNILCMDHFKTVLPELARRGSPYSIFYETKANLRKEQVQQLADAGIRWIQPGIESLDSRVLALIAKGSSASINLQLLKWAGECGIRVTWNWLSCVPGEEDAWYFEMAELIPWISHLEPPNGMADVQVVRYSPYHDRPGDFGLELQPNPFYAFIYPLDEKALEALAYTFVDAGAGSKAPSLNPATGRYAKAGLEALRMGIEEWRRGRGSSEPAKLEVTDEGRRLEDTRPRARRKQWDLSPVQREILAVADTAIGREPLIQRVAETCREDPEAVSGVIREWLDHRVLLEVEGRLLSLASRPRQPHIRFLTRSEFPGGYASSDLQLPLLLRRLAGK